MQGGLIFKKISLVMKEVGSISKDKKNTHQNYSFRGIEDMYNVIHPVLITHGVFCAPETLEFKTESHMGVNQNGQSKLTHRVLLKIAHRFYAEDGSFISVTTIGEGIDTSDKASNKAMSAAMKYAFIELLSIPTVDIEDSEKEGSEIVQKNHTNVSQNNTAGLTPPGWPGSFPIPLKLKKRVLTVGELTSHEVSGDLTYWINRSKKEGKPLTGDIAAYVEALEAFQQQGPVFNDRAFEGDLP